MANQLTPMQEFVSLNPKFCFVSMTVQHAVRAKQLCGIIAQTKSIDGVEQLTTGGFAALLPRVRQRDLIFAMKLARVYMERNGYPGMVYPMREFDNWGVALYEIGEVVNRFRCDIMTHLVETADTDALADLQYMIDVDIVYDMNTVIYTYIHWNKDAQYDIIEEDRGEVDERGNPIVGYIRVRTTFPIPDAGMTDNVMQQLKLYK